MELKQAQRVLKEERDGTEIAARSNYDNFCRPVPASPRHHGLLDPAP
jgi:hypothetical protein